MRVGLDELLAFRPAFPYFAWPLCLRIWKALEVGLAKEESPSGLYTALINFLSLQCIFSPLCPFSNILFYTASTQYGSLSQGRTLRTTLKVSLTYKPILNMCKGPQNTSHAAAKLLIVSLTNTFSYRVFQFLITLTASTIWSWILGTGCLSQIELFTEI